MRVIYLLFNILLIITSCTRNSSNLASAERGAVPELLVYCENGMVSPIMEISAIFEAQYNCKVRVHNDCARNIINIINYSKKGDVFIPDSQSAISWLKQADSLIVIDSLYIGMNKMVVIVKKDNPSSFDGQLTSLTDPKHAVVLANPETSSLGFETMQLLIDNSIYNETMLNVMTLTVDSKGLLRSVVNDKASVAIDWLSSYMGQEIEIETFDIYTENSNSMIYATLLKNSEYLGLAYSFMAALSSTQSSEIFAKYGIEKQNATIL